MLLLMLMRAVTTRNIRSRIAALTRAKVLMAQDLGRGKENKPQQLAADFVTALLYYTVLQFAVINIFPVWMVHR